MRLSIELQDVLQHARPHISELSVIDTASALDARDGAFMSYDGAFRDCPKMSSGMVTDKLLEKQLFDKREWVQSAILEVAKSLNKYITLNGLNWINVDRKPIQVLSGLSVKPSIRGIVIENRRASPVLVIARRSIMFDIQASLPFLMRGGYEFHLRDEPNFSDFRVLDLSVGEKGEARRYAEYKLSSSQMMPLAEFEDVLVRYAQAAAMSKYGLNIPSGMPIRDLFKR